MIFRKNIATAVILFGISMINPYYASASDVVVPDFEPNRGGYDIPDHYLCVEGSPLYPDCVRIIEPDPKVVEHFKKYPLNLIAPQLEQRTSRLGESLYNPKHIPEYAAPKLCRIHAPDYWDCIFRAR